MEPILIPKYTSPFTAIRSALARIGFQDAMQTMEPELIEWCIEAQDLISKPRTFIVDEDDFVSCNNQIMLPSEWTMLNCISHCGQPLSLQVSKGCVTGRCAKTSPNRGCNNYQGFTLDTCYVNFTPAVKDGFEVHVEGLKRPYGEDGYPLVNEACILAVSEYVASKVCFRHRDNRYNELNRKWLFHCRTARADLNRLNNTQQENIGFIYHKPPVPFSFWVGTAVGLW